jgi:hypothetical protein
MRLCGAIETAKAMNRTIIQLAENVYWKDERIIGVTENDCQSFSDLQAQNKNSGYKTELLRKIWPEPNPVPSPLIWAASQARKTVNQQI